MLLEVFVVMVIYIKDGEDISIIKTYSIRPLIKYAPTILLKPNDPHHLIRKILLEDFLVDRDPYFTLF